jgi:DNA-binding protein HU-beta
MNKADLVNQVQEAGDYQSNAAAKQAVEDVLAAITHGVTHDGRVQLVGFGTFAVRERPARMGRNPRTGEAIQIQASKTVNFKPGKGLKEQL